MIVHLFPPFVALIDNYSLSFESFESTRISNNPCPFLFQMIEWKRIHELFWYLHSLVFILLVTFLRLTS
jgi:hypothetical protein